MRRHRWPVQFVIEIVMGAALLASCQPETRPEPQQNAAADTVSARMAIDSLRSAYEQGVAAGNFDQLGAMLAEGAIMVPPGGPQWDAMYASSKLPFPPGATIAIKPIEIRVLSDDWAYEFGNSTVTYKPAGADTTQTMQDTYIILFRKTPGGWKVFREVASSNLPVQTPTPR